MADVGAEPLSGAGLSGNAVRGIAENAVDPLSPQGVANASQDSLAEIVHQAADFIVSGFDLAGRAVGEAVDVASNKAFQGAANVGANIATPPDSLGQPVFSWGGYFQALGILCLLLAALWFGVWLLRRYGKFNFIPRPGSLPKNALVMEAQMSLGPRKGLMVVRFLNRRLLLGVTDHQITYITEESAQDGRQKSDFQGIMEQARNSSADSGTGGAVS